MVGESVDGGQGHSVVKKVEARTETVRGSTREGDTHFTRDDYVIAVWGRSHDLAKAPRRLSNPGQPTTRGTTTKMY